MSKFAEAVKAMKEGKAHDSVGLRLLLNAKEAGLRPIWSADEFDRIIGEAEFVGHSYHIDYVCKTFVHDFMRHPDVTDQRDPDRVRDWAKRLLGGMKAFADDLQALREVLYDMKEKPNANAEAGENDEAETAKGAERETEAADPEEAAEAAGGEEAPKAKGRSRRKGAAKSSGK